MQHLGTVGTVFNPKFNMKICYITSKMMRFRIISLFANIYRAQITFHMQEEWLLGWRKRRGYYERVQGFNSFSKVMSWRGTFDVNCDSHYCEVRFVNNRFVNNIVWKEVWSITNILLSNSIGFAFRSNRYISKFIHNLN